MSDTKHIPPHHVVEKERKEFLSLIKENPNYFGNIASSSLQPGIKIISNTEYEELKCVGFCPESDFLEAIIYIKRETGYDGGLCTHGSKEYVRFYLSYDNGVTWHDQGVTDITVWDVPGKKPLEDAVKLHISPEKKKCIVENLPKLRAILSWNVAPPPNTPNYHPVWGNVHEGRIQIGTIQAGEGDTVKALSASELHTLYAEHKVASHRYLYPTIQDLKKAEEPFTPALANSKVAALKNIDINLTTVINSIIKINGDTTYEQIGCIGLDTNACILEATVKIKKPYGYLGGLCTTGSYEYVAFWMDFGAGWQYVGMDKFNVHDIHSIPPEGIDYAVFIYNLPDKRVECQKGPITAKVRAILSWETPPPPANPNWLPIWGNRAETLVLIPPR